MHSGESLTANESAVYHSIIQGYQSILSRSPLR